MTTMARTRPRSSRSKWFTSGLMRYAKKMAKRKAISVARATYRKPSPSANSSTVIRTRAVRESASSNKFSRALDSAAGFLVPDYFRIISGNRHPYKLEMIALIHPECPVKRLAVKVQPQQFSFCASNRDLLFADQFHADTHRSSVLRNKSAKIRRFAAPVIFLVFTRGDCEVLPGEDFAVNEEIVVEHRGCGGQQECLFGCGLGWGCRDPLFQELIVGKHRNGTARSLAPFVVDQLATGRHFEIGFLAGRIARVDLLELRLDDAVRVLQLDGERFRGHPLSANKNSERSGVNDHWS